MKIALEKQELELTLPLYLAGYANRKEPAYEIHDPLFINCLYFENSTHRIASFSIDLLGIYHGQYKLLIERIKKNFKDPKLEIILSCVHTHAAPDLNERMETSLNKDLLSNEIVAKAVKLIEMCRNNAVESSLFYGHRLVNDVGANRRDEHCHANVRLQALKFETKDSPAYVVNFNCHPTLLSESNIKISKDYQGYCMDVLCAKGFKPLYFQAACGDISTRFTRHEQSFKDAKRLGELLGSHCLELPFETLNVQDFNFNHFSFELPKKAYRDEAYYISELERYKTIFEDSTGKVSPGELRIIETAMQGSYVEWTMSKQIDKIPSTIPCSLITFGSKLALVYLPFELFSKIQDEIIEKSPFDHTLIIGYTFDGLGYLPDEASVKDGGYEVLSCTYEANAAGLLVDAVVKKLNDDLESSQ